MKWRSVRTSLLVAVTLLMSMLVGLAVPAATMPAYAQGPGGDPGLVAFYRQTEGFVIDPLAARVCDVYGDGCDHRDDNH